MMTDAELIACWAKCGDDTDDRLVLLFGELVRLRQRVRQLEQARDSDEEYRREQQERGT